MGSKFNDRQRREMSKWRNRAGSIYGSYTMDLRWLSRWLPPLLWMGLIFYLSAQPDLPSAREAWLDLLLKKGGHAAVYAVLAILFQRALGWGRSRWLPWPLVILYAVSDELHQSLVPGRHARASDVLIDALVAGIALLMLRWRWAEQAGSRFRQRASPVAPRSRAASEAPTPPGTRR
jgi:VanZ family protein